MAVPQTRLDYLYESLADDTCAYCDAENAFRRRTYKDTPAVVCAECGTPALRVW